MNLAELRHKSTDHLREMARNAGLAHCETLRRHDLVVELLKDMGKSREDIRAAGVLEVLSDGFGFLRWPCGHFQPGSQDIYVSPSQIRRFDLRTGDAVEGVIRAPKDGERYFALLRVSHVNQLDPDRRPHRCFEQLRALRPSAALDLGSAEHHWLRLTDAIAPLGLGQRCVIRAPAGGSGHQLLAEIARHVSQHHQDTELIVALLDARPEDAEAMAESTRGEVVAATIAQPPTRQVQVAEMTANRARRLVELGNNVVLVFDSLSALYEAASSAPAEGAPHWAPLAAIKSVLASAYRCEGGGSLTLLATVGNDRALGQRIAGIANAELNLVLDATGQPELDPVLTRSEHYEAFTDEAACQSIAVARSRLAMAPRSEAVRRAAHGAANSSSSADLRELLKS